MRNLEKGQHIFIAFQDGKAVLDSQLRPRIYTSLENAEKWTPTVDKGKIEYVEYASTLTPPNEPLTLDELREMDGEPVYIVFSPDVDGEKLQFWALVSVDEWDDVYLANKDEWAFNYEEFLEDVEAIYRRPPEQIDMLERMESE